MCGGLNGSDGGEDPPSFFFVKSEVEVRRHQIDIIHRDNLYMQHLFFVF